MISEDSTSIPTPAILSQETSYRKGIVLVCFEDGVRNRVACVVEKETKSWKTRGQTGLVFETLEEGEEPNEYAVFRALNEELGLVGSDAVVSFMERGEFHLVVEEETRRIIFEAKVLLVILKRGTEISQVLDSSDELISRGMREVSSLNGDTRPGTLLALQLAMGSHVGTSDVPIVLVRNGEEIQPES